MNSSRAHKLRDFQFAPHFLTASFIVIFAFSSACTRGNSNENGADHQIPTATSPNDGLISVSQINPTVRPEQLDFSDELLERIQVPGGFQIQVFARDLTNPRIIVVSERGDVYVSEREAGRVRLLRDSNGDGVADVSEPVASGLGEKLQGVHGLAIHEGKLYMVTETDLYSATIQDNGHLDEPELIMNEIPSGGQHPNRTLGFGPDGMLYVSVGSTCNACVEPDERHATMIRYDADGTNPSIFAKGLRNTVGFAWHPTTGELWGLDHNSDGRGNDLPPEELNHIQEGKDYGWPFCYGDRQIDFHVPVGPDDKTREEYCQATEPPVLAYQGHAAPMQLIFYTGDQFPADYRNFAFATMRGSWNRNPPVGYEVIGIRFNDQGQPTEAVPFANGWLTNGGQAHFGRLTGLAQAGDGSLIVGDDHNGILYRISYDPQ